MEDLGLRTKSDVSYGVVDIIIRFTGRTEAEFVGRPGG